MESSWAVPGEGSAFLIREAAAAGALLGFLLRGDKH